MNNKLTKWSLKYGRYAIHNLILYIIIGQAVVYAFDYIVMQTDINLIPLLVFDRNAILSGEVWRVFTFILIPPGDSFLFISRGAIFVVILALYFYWIMGGALENQWGAFKFNVFYFVGIIGTILGGLITGYATNEYINMSLFLAFAALYPNFEILLFFILPIKVKYLAMVYAILLLFSLVTVSIPGKAAILVSIINLALFFGPQMWGRYTQWRRRSAWKQKYRR